MPFIDYGLDVLYYVCMPRNKGQPTEVEIKRGKGQPRRFTSGEELKTAMAQYLTHSQGHALFPSIAGFCVFCDMTHETYLQNGKYYPDAFSICEMMLESIVLSQHPQLNARVAFYLKNKFSNQYTDRTEQAIFTPEPLKINYDKLSEDELRTIKGILDK